MLILKWSKEPERHGGRKGFRFSCLVNGIVFEKLERSKESCIRECKIMPSSRKTEII